MSTSTFRFPAKLEGAELEQILKAQRADAAQSPAEGFVHRGRLNLGPAILLATTLSAGCWFVIIKLGLKLFH